MEKEGENTFLEEFSMNCPRCHNLFIKHRCLCVTCKAPCLNCLGRSTCTISTDTHDFEKYLESLTRKPKIALKVKTVGTDTCDLDSHFDYYNKERTSIIQKSVGTYCNDLHFRKLLTRKRTRKQMSECVDDTDFEFNWDVKSDTKTHSRCSVLKKSETCENESVIPVLNTEENKENYDSVTNTVSDSVREINFEDSSSDESDLDLITSSKVSKCRKIAKIHKLTLTQIEVGNEKIFKCSVCGKTFSKKYLCVLHLASHVDESKYDCQTCESSFSSSDLLHLHMKDVHGEIVLSNMSEESDEKDCDGKINNPHDKILNGNNLEANQTEKSYQCMLCLNIKDSPNRFPTYKALYLHKRLKHGVKEKKLIVSGEREPRLKRRFICLFCGKEFKNNKALNDHLPVHTGEKNYLCDICNKSYTTSANLHIHKRTHMGLKNFKCTLCDKAFHKKDSLKVHFRKHSGERPFQCDLCPMKFDRNFILKNHRLRHFSEKTYICQVCGKAFTTHGGLNNHEKSHKRDPSLKKPRKPAVKPTLDTENAVICDVCGKVYSTRSNLRMHKFVHLGLKPFQCPVCHQSYAKKDSMLTHMRKHTDERPFSCETCGMAFYRNHTLKTHRLRHTGERPHKCNMCGKSFTQSSSLAYHIKHHNKKEEKKKVHFTEEQSKVHRKKKFAGRAVKAKDVVEKSEEQELVNEMVVVNEANDISYPKNGPLMVPVIKKELLVVDVDVAMDTIEKSNGQTEVFETEKEGNNQFTLNKLNYYIAKTNHVLSIPKDNYKPKVVYKKDEQPEVENLIISRNNCITKDGNLLMNKEVWMKNEKDGFTEVRDHREEEKTENVLPIAGEILNATFLSDENGEVIPFGSMTLQSVNAENIMISPLIKVESEEDGDGRKGLNRGSRLAVFDSKMKYHTTPPAKALGKTNCQILNLKDSRMQQRIQLINSEPLSFHIQVPVSCTAVTDDGVLNGITSTGTYYSSV